MIRVPTVAELVRRRLAHPIQGGFTITPEGQKMIYDAMQANADEGRAADEVRS